MPSSVNEREHLPRPTARKRAFLDDPDPIGCDDRGQHRVEIDWAQGAQVGHLRRDALLGQPDGCLEAVVDAFIAPTSVD